MLSFDFLNMTASVGSLLQLMPGDIISWRCTYDTSDIVSNSSIQGGYSASRDSLQEHCTVVLHYWPRVNSMRGCFSAAVGGVQHGENMCSSEAEDLLQVTQAEAQRFPIRWVLFGGRFLRLLQVELAACPASM